MDLPIARAVIFRGRAEVIFRDREEVALERNGRSQRQRTAGMDFAKVPTGLDNVVFSSERQWLAVGSSFRPYG
jgi:hypothetical protein